MYLYNGKSVGYFPSFWELYFCAKWLVYACMVTISLLKERHCLKRCVMIFGTGTSSLRPLCPTRWTVKHKAFESVLINYEPLLQSLDMISSGLDGSTCLEVRSKAGGIYYSLQTFDLLFGIMLSERFFGIEQ